MTYAVASPPKAPRVAHQRARGELESARYYEGFHGPLAGAEDCASDEHWDGESCQPGLCPPGMHLEASGCVEGDISSGGGSRRVSPGSPPDPSQASLLGSYGFLALAALGALGLLYFARAR